MYRINKRLYYIPDFVERFVDNEHWDTSKKHWYSKHLRGTDILVWNKKINRWIVYRKLHEMPWRWREYVGQYTMMIVCEMDRKTHAYREPGSWINRTLREGDLSKGGSRGLKEVTTTFDQIIMRQSEGEKEIIRKLVDIYTEMNKDKDMIGRTSILVGHIEADRRHKKVKKKVVRFISKQTGQHLGTMVNGKMHLAIG